MGLYRSSHLGVYLVLSNIIKIKPDIEVFRTCRLHGRMRFDYCPECGTKTNEREKTVSTRTTKDLGDIGKYTDFFVHISSYTLDNEDQALLVPNHGGPWSIDNCSDEPYSIIDFDSIPSKKRKEIILCFQERYSDYVKFLVDQDIEVKIKFGYLLWYS